MKVKDMKLLQSLAVIMAFICRAWAEGTDTIESRNKLQNSTSFQTAMGIECTLYTVAVNMGRDTEDKDHEVIHCIDDNDLAYMVYNLPESLLKARSGSARIQVEANAINGYDIDLQRGSAKTLSVLEEEPLPTNRPLPYIGDWTAVVVRVTGADNYSPSNSASKMSDEVFGTDSDQFNLSSGYDGCSGGKTTFSPCMEQTIVDQGAGAGVLDITIPQNVNGVSSYTVQNYVTIYLSDTLGFDRTQCTNVLYAMPSVVSMGIAYGYYNDYLTVYKSPWESRPSAQMHELGHNFNFRHSNEGGEYKDETCMMGYSYNSDDGPRMCFNAAKSWFFGWYADRHINVDTNLGMKGKLISIDDYLNNDASESDQYTIAHVYGSSIDSYYLMFNRKEGINSGVKEYGNQVVIVKQNGSTGSSETMAHLSTGKQFTKSNFALGTSTLVIKVCDIVYESAPGLDYAYVVIEVNNNGSVDCPSPTSSPTSEPTSNPTKSPTKNPTQSSTKNPTKSPTKNPTSTPSKNPTRSPSKNPTQTPAKNPTISPNKNPTTSPTKTSTNTPTKNPTSNPSKNPTTSPTKNPTSTPSKNPTMSPSKNPTQTPSKNPTSSPTKNPTTSPTKSSTNTPTQTPTSNPSKNPTTSPTKNPTTSPTKNPTMSPTKNPTLTPAKNPTTSPTKNPTTNPTTSPTQTSTKKPTANPTKIPTTSPTQTPTKKPTNDPTETPTKIPTKYPTSSPTKSLCKDDHKWKYSKKDVEYNCGWVYKNTKCNVKGQDENGNKVKAKNACPIACNNEKKCTIPKCLKNSEWSSKNNQYKSCKKIGKIKNTIKKKKACALKGTNKLFGYEACRQCKHCK